MSLGSGLDKLKTSHGQTMTETIYKNEAEIEKIKYNNLSISLKVHDIAKRINDMERRQSIISLKKIEFDKPNKKCCKIM